MFIEFMTPLKNLLFILLVFVTATAFALPPAGFVVGWGIGSGARSGTPQPSPQDLADVVAISAGFRHGMALKSDGRVIVWGHIGTNLAAAPPDLTDVIAISAGERFCLALKKNGSLVAWGEDLHGETHVPPGLSNVIAIAAGKERSLALRSDGTVVGWGANSGAGLKAPSNIAAIATGGSQYERNLAIKRDGTVVPWGNEAEAPHRLSNIVAIAVGDHHSLALRSDGTVVGWGDNGAGQSTGIPTQESPYEDSGPVQIGGNILDNVVAIAAGKDFGIVGVDNRFSLALRKDGKVTAWGHIDGKPVTVPVELRDVVAIAAGRGFCLAITTNKAVADQFEHMK